MTQDEYKYTEKRFDRLENMLGQLINTVGKIMEEQASIKSDISSIREEQTSMKNDISSMREEQASMKSDISSMQEEQTSMKNDISSMREEQASMKKENETRHEEVMKQLHAYKADNDLLWDKTTKNEREIGIVKKLYSF